MWEFELVPVGFERTVPAWKEEKELCRDRLTPTQRIQLWPICMTSTEGKKEGLRWVRILLVSSVFLNPGVFYVQGWQGAGGLMFHVNSLSPLLVHPTPAWRGKEARPQVTIATATKIVESSRPRPVLAFPWQRPRRFHMPPGLAATQVCPLQPPVCLPNRVCLFSN